jgi:6-pyruvoyltetrahydropterin/6-carboxytetrahydropterin synthase
MKTYSVSRQIGIDAGHRIMTHGSKCRHIHGHRYTVEATCIAGDRLHESGEQTDMVLDFGFLKDEMMRHIDAPCDHGMIVSADDEDVLMMFAPPGRGAEWGAVLAQAARKDGWAETDDGRVGQKLYVVPFQPTAECLARHWYYRLKDSVAQRSDGLATLEEVVVWETPNCRASYKA